MQPTAEQFTEKAWAAILSAQQLAQKRRHPEVARLLLVANNGLQLVRKSERRLEELE